MGDWDGVVIAWGAGAVRTGGAGGEKTSGASTMGESPSGSTISSTSSSSEMTKGAKEGERDGKGTQSRLGFGGRVPARPLISAAHSAASSPAKR